MSLQQSNKKKVFPSELNVISKLLCFSLRRSKLKKQQWEISFCRNETTILSTKLKIFDCPRRNMLSLLPCCVPPTEFNTGKHFVKSVRAIFSLHVKSLLEERCTDSQQLELQLSTDFPIFIYIFIMLHKHKPIPSHNLT